LAGFLRGDDAGDGLADGGGAAVFDVAD